MKFLITTVAALAAAPLLAQSIATTASQEPSWKKAEAEVNARAAAIADKSRAKNVIIFIGDGMVGLNTVFLAGGAKGMLISRWRVPDESAPGFMNVFYERIVAGEMPVDALASAKRDLKKTYSEASHWAVFKYVGIPW